MPKVSIIIPFNNVESYIGQCLDSVVNQTLDDIEIICVNDASNDSSRKIVEEYSLKDSRIRIIDIETRQGQGYARNRAIEAATGEYIGFVDADDYIEPDMFFELYQKAKSNDNDITICQVREYDDLNKKYILSDYYSLSLLESFQDNVFSAVDVKDKLLDINVALWNKIYKKSYLDGIGEKFPEGFIYEDLPFFFGTFLPAKKIQVVWKNLYVYRINRVNSTMQQFNNKILDRLDMVSWTYEKLKKFDFLSDMMHEIKGWIINDLFHRYTLLKDNYQREFFFKMKKIFESLEINDINNPYWKMIYHFDGYLMVLNNDFDSFNQKLFTQYLDLHEVENRLRAELKSGTEGLSSDISHTKSQITETKGYINNIESELSRKISETNIGIDNVKSELSQKVIEANIGIDNVKSELSQKVIEANIDIDNVKSELYKEIQEVYDYQNQSKAMNDDKISKIQLDFNDRIGGVFEKNATDYNELIALIENTANNLKSVIKNEQDLNISTVNSKIDSNKENLIEIIKQNFNEVNEKITAQSDTDREFYHKELSNLKKEFENAFQEQKNYYEYQNNILKERIAKLERSFVSKLKEKIKKKVKCLKFL